MESAGEMIRRYREAGGHTLEDVALAVNLTFGAVSQWENGRTHPRRATAFKLDDFLQARGAIVAALGYARPVSQAGPSIHLLEAQVLHLESVVADIVYALQTVPRLAAALEDRARTAGPSSDPASP